MNNLQQLLFSKKTEDKDFQDYLKHLLSGGTYQSLKNRDFLEHREATRIVVINAYRKKYKSLNYPFVHASGFSVEKFLSSNI